MADGNVAKQQSDIQIQVYLGYLEDLGRIGGRHENARTFYMSVMSALFVFLAMAGKDGIGILVNLQSDVLKIVAAVGILVCAAWFEHMRSFSKLFFTKLSTLSGLEEDLALGRPLKPFTVEKAALEDHPNKKAPTQKKHPNGKWNYTPLTTVDKVTPVGIGLLFVGLFFLKGMK